MKTPYPDAICGSAEFVSFFAEALGCGIYIFHAKCQFH